MGPVDPQRTVEEWVQESPEILLLLENLQFDYWRVRGLPLSLVCEMRGLDPRSFSLLLEGYRQRNQDLKDEVLDSLSVPELIGYILFNHHHYAEREFPRIQEALQAAMEEDQGAHGELLELQVPLVRFLTTLREHIQEEERHFFPFFALMASDPEAPVLEGEELGELLALVHREDEELLGQLSQVRERTRWYHVPEDAGPAYRRLLSGLCAMEVDLRKHMRIENRILYPKVMAVLQGVREGRRTGDPRSFSGGKDRVS